MAMLWIRLLALAAATLTAHAIPGPPSSGSSGDPSATAAAGANGAADISSAQADLSTYLNQPVAPGAREQVIESAERALAAARGRDRAAVAAAFTAAREAAPQLGDWLRVLEAGAVATFGDTAEVTRLLAAAGSELESEWGWRARVEARLAAGDTAAAIRAAETAATSGSARKRAEALVLEAGLRRTRGERNAALASLRRAIEIAPSTTAAVDAARMMSKIGGLTPEDALLVGRTYLRHGNVDRGVAGIDQYLEAGRGTAAERAALRLEAGRALFNGARYDVAERRLSQLAEEQVATAVAAEALFLTARSRYRSGRIQEGLATFRRVIERYPGQPFAAEAAYILADLEQDDGEFEQARALFRQTMTLQPTALEAGLAAMRLGGLAYLDGDLEGALDIYESYRSRFPQGRRVQQATYWAARIYRELGRNDLARQRLEQARSIDPFSYYGVRAAELLGVEPLAIPLAAEPRAADEPTAQANVAVFRLALLDAIGPQGAAAFERDRLRRYFDSRPNGWYVLAEALNEAGFAYDGILLGRDIEQREGRLNPRLLRIIYPFPYRELILPAARDNGVDPYLVAGLIRQESMYSPAIVSPAGAIGLMQVMPATGTTLAAELGVDGFEPQRDLRRPEINVRLGVHYLARRLNEYGGDVVSALAAYNAGAHRVEFWSQFPEYGDPELFAERIPFAETRDYVKIVQANARIYEALYGD